MTPAFGYTAPDEHNNSDVDRYRITATCDDCGETFNADQIRLVTVQRATLTHMPKKKFLCSKCEEKFK